MIFSERLIVTQDRKSIFVFGKNEIVNEKNIITTQIISQIYANVEISAIKMKTQDNGEQ